MMKSKIRFFFVYRWWYFNLLQFVLQVFIFDASSHHVPSCVTVSHIKTLLRKDKKNSVDVIEEYCLGVEWRWWFWYGVHTSSQCIPNNDDKFDTVYIVSQCIQFRLKLFRNHLFSLLMRILKITAWKGGREREGEKWRRRRRSSSIVHGINTVYVVKVWTAHDVLLLLSICISDPLAVILWRLFVLLCASYRSNIIEKKAKDTETKRLHSPIVRRHVQTNSCDKIMRTTRDVLLYLLVFFVDMFFFLFSFRIDMGVCVCLTVSDCTCVVLFYLLLSAVEWRKRGSCQSFNPRINFLSHVSLFLLLFLVSLLFLLHWFLFHRRVRISRVHVTVRFEFRLLCFFFWREGVSIRRQTIHNVIEKVRWWPYGVVVALACSDLSNSDNAHRGSTSSRCGSGNCYYWIVCGFWSELGCGRHGSGRTSGFEITDR